MRTTTLARLTATLLVFTAPARAAEEGFVSLFNGRSLEGWEGNTTLWSVQDGAITGQTKADTNLKHNTFLVWKGGTVDDFELRLRYRIVNGNSGIQYRSKVVEQGAQGPIVAGYQADFEAGKTYSGILYEERGRGILAQRGQKTRIVADAGKHKVEVTGAVGKSDEIQAAIRNEDWNDYVIVARGNHLTHTINGRTTVDVTDEDAAHAAKSGILAFQVHVGPPMTVQFKDVRIKRLGAGGDQAAASDLDRMQGEWTPVSGLRDGEAIPEEWLKSVRLTFKGGQYDITWTDGGDTGSVKLKDGTNPKQMDIASDGAGPIPGIYEFTGDNLRLAYALDGGDRPKTFGGASRTTITYRRK